MKRLPSDASHIMSRTTHKPAAAPDRLAASHTFMLADLARSGLTPNDISVKPLPIDAKNKRICYSDKGYPWPSYRIYYSDGATRDRIDTPPELLKTIKKYRGPRGRNSVFFRSENDAQAFSEAEVKVIVEGEKKAAAFALRTGVPTAGIGGCDNGAPGGELHQTLAEAIQPGDRVIVLLDGDVADPHKRVGKAAATLKAALEARGALVEFPLLPDGLGADDWLVRERFSSSQEAVHALGNLPRFDPGTLSREHRFDPQRSRIGETCLRRAPPAPPWIVEQFLPIDVGVLVAPGGTGKSTLTLLLAIHVALGLPVFGIATLKVDKPGHVLLLTAEDDRRVLLYRLHHIARGLGLSDQHVAALGERVHIEDVVGTGLRLAEAGEYGNLRVSAVTDDLIAAYRESDVSLVIADPLANLGPGEQRVNDAEAMVITAGRRISRALKACVLFVHHTGKEVAREKVVDQYAARGGSALSDGARFVLVLATHGAEDKLATPQTIPPEAVKDGRVLRLHVAKQTHAPRIVDPLWFVRDGFTFRTHIGPPASREDQAEAYTNALVIQIASVVRELRAKGLYPSRGDVIEAMHDRGVPQKRARNVINRAISMGVLAEPELPEGNPLKRRYRKDFLALPEEAQGRRVVRAA